MVRGSKINGMVMLLLLLGTAIVYAAPTISDNAEDGVLFAEPDSSYVYSHYGQVKDSDAGLFKSHLVFISEEFNKPPVTYDNPIDKEVGVKSLPPAPGTFLMAFVGFLCVSLVKDRRIWLAILSGVLWVSQAGISLLPQLALNLSAKALPQKQSSSHCLARSYEPKRSNRLRSDIEGTRYVGLLRHLDGIPNAETSSLPFTKVRLKLTEAFGRTSLSFYRRTCCPGQSVQSFCSPGPLLRDNFQNTFRYYKKAPHFAITAISFCLNHAIHCLISGAGQLNCITTAFINASLARGPPDFN